MQHALALARKGVGLTSPNPMVGCVIVREGQIVGEGFHQYEWLDHAEIVALKSAGEKARGATLYVTLEPCNHTGRTGPCTEAIIAAGVHRVVAAMEDPNPVNSGRGFERLRAAGIEMFTACVTPRTRCCPASARFSLTIPCSPTAAASRAANPSFASFSIRNCASHQHPESSRPLTTISSSLPPRR